MSRYTTIGQLNIDDCTAYIQSVWGWKINHIHIIDNTTNVGVYLNEEHIQEILEDLNELKTWLVFRVYSVSLHNDLINTSVIYSKHTVVMYWDEDVMAFTYNDFKALMEQLNEQIKVIHDKFKQETLGVGAEYDKEKQLH